MRFRVRYQSYQKWGLALLLVGVLAATGAGAARADMVNRAAFVSVHGNRFNAEVNGLFLSDALTALARAIPLKVTITGPPPEQRVFLNLREVDLEDGIRQLLRGQSYVLVYTAEPVDSGAPALAEIIVFGSGGSSDTSVTARPDRLAAVTETTRTAAPTSGTGARPTEVRGRERALRRAELEGLRQGEPASELERQLHHELVVALVDSDEWVRAAALGRLRHSREPVPVKLVVRVARQDSQPWLRIQALELLAERAGAEAQESLRFALRDSDPEVRERALELLDNLRFAGNRGLSTERVGRADAWHRTR